MTERGFSPRWPYGVGAVFFVCAGFVCVVYEVIVYHSQDTIYSCKALLLGKRGRLLEGEETE